MQELMWRQKIQDDDFWRMRRGREMGNEKLLRNEDNDVRQMAMKIVDAMRCEPAKKAEH